MQPGFKYLMKLVLSRWYFAPNRLGIWDFGHRTPVFAKLRLGRPVFAKLRLGKRFGIGEPGVTQVSGRSV